MQATMIGSSVSSETIRKCERLAELLDIVLVIEDRLKTKVRLLGNRVGLDPWEIETILEGFIDQCITSGENAAMMTLCSEPQLYLNQY